MHGPLPNPTELERPYYQAGRDGDLKLQRCKTCETTFFPPARRCVHCGSLELHWEKMSGKGTIWSWVKFRKQYFSSMPAPYTVVRVQLDEGPMIITNLVGADSREPEIGAAVRVVFEEAGDLFLPQFTYV